MNRSDTCTFFLLYFIVVQKAITVMLISIWFVDVIWCIDVNMVYFVVDGDTGVLLSVYFEVCALLMLTVAILVCHIVC